MFVDDVTIKAEAGNGGDGKVAFQRNLMSLGPTGGTGGTGGSIYFEGVSDLSALRQFRFKKEIRAVHGGLGRPQFVDGKTPDDIILKVPVGTVIHNLDTKQDIEIVLIGEKILGAKGGRGGRGNFHFRGPKNTSPMQFGKGKPGDKFNIRLELKLIADVGLIGLPNAGKSSLLNELTRADARVANYPFTTLEPNLGAYYDLIIADIPGLIEGASAGKGLGIKFLRHVERTPVLFHLISSESETPYEDYKTIREELGAYSKALLDKPEYIFLSKTDILDEKGITAKLKMLKKIKKDIIPISIADEQSLKKVEVVLNELAAEKRIKTKKELEALEAERKRKEAEENPEE